MLLRSLAALVLAMLGAHAADAQQPNIVFVYTDDQRFDEVAFMPNLMERVVEQGATMERFYAVTPACCPARATVLRAQYAHSHGVLTSRGEFSGGWDEWRRLGLGVSTLATWLQDAGYRTHFNGKYVNGYPSDADRLYVPPGWDDWFAGYMRFTRGAFYDWRANHNGVLEPFGFGPENYRTDVEGEVLTTFIADAIERGEPFFALYAPIAPHAIGAEDNLALPPTPADRHIGTLAHLPPLRRPSYDEADVSDKINFIQRFPRLTSEEIQRIDRFRQARAESMLSVDDVLGDVLDLLEATGQIDNTYIVFSSDNGFHLGEHRLPPERKGLPYEESVRMPMYVRGPGIAPGHTVQALASNLDLAQTFADWAGASVPAFVEGRSLRDLLRGAGAPYERTALLNEQWVTTDGAPELFQTIVTDQYKLTRWATLDDALELYNLDLDSGELLNVVNDEPEVVAELLDVLDALEQCSGAECRIADRLWTGRTATDDDPRDSLDTGLTVVGPFPNPARGEVSVRLRTPVATNATVRLIDPLGRVVASARQLVDVEGAAVRFTTRDLPAGAYVMEIEGTGDRVVRSFVVIR